MTSLISTLLGVAGFTLAKNAGLVDEKVIGNCEYCGAGLTASDRTCVTCGAPVKVVVAAPPARYGRPNKTIPELYQRVEDASAWKNLPNSFQHARVNASILEDTLLLLGISVPESYRIKLAKFYLGMNDIGHEHYIKRWVSQWDEWFKSESAPDRVIVHARAALQLQLSEHMSIIGALKKDPELSAYRKWFNLREPKQSDWERYHLETLYEELREGLVILNRTIQLMDYELNPTGVAKVVKDFLEQMKPLERPYYRYFWQIIDRALCDEFAQSLYKLGDNPKKYHGVLQSSKVKAREARDLLETTLDQLESEMKRWSSHAQR